MELNQKSPIDVIAIMGKAGAGKDTVADIIRKQIGFDNTVKYSFADPLKKMCSYVFQIPIVWMYDQNLKTKDVVINLNNKITFERMTEWVENEIQSKPKWEWIIADPSLSGWGDGRRSEDVTETLLSKFSQFLYKMEQKGEVESVGVADDFGLGSSNAVYRLTIRKLLQYMGTEIIRDTIHESFWAEVKQKVGDSLVVIPDCRFESETDFVINETLNNAIIIVENPDLKTSFEHSSEKFVDEVESVYPDYTFYHIENNLKGHYTHLRNQVKAILKQMDDI